MSAESSDVLIIDSGGANIGSIVYALERLGVSAILSDDVTQIESAARVILPGVGAARPAMQQLHARGLVDVIRRLTQPVLGICLGMQLMFESSEEGDVECLGLIPGRVRAMRAAPGARVPHMGWNTLEVRTDAPLLAGLAQDARAYFVHSYSAPVNRFTLAESTHADAFAAVVRCENFHGVQFHPERSGDLGARLLKNFVSMSAA